MADPDGWITDELLDRVLLGLGNNGMRERSILKYRLQRLSVTIELFAIRKHRPNSRELAKRANSMHKAIQNVLKLVATMDDAGRWRANLDETDFGLSLASGLGLIDDPENLEQNLQSGGLKRRLQRDIDRIQRWQSAAETVASQASSRVSKGKGGSRHAADPTRAQVIGELVNTYLDITRKRPTVSKTGDKPSGKFIDFCCAILSAMGRPTEPDAIAQQFRRHQERLRETNQS
ncbi:hypothetical protein T8K17_22745 [Thalassobaculum sp. OXR-137]|uniref:hypothetical protein n=1 Tax=Thalassobaculum sp. OXR-137 TaxID=3100173 RepID=UPI002AC92696|nr:hypothetical protein [Thalassobaculum sp. OXR-137]WPZ34043.1 hypothetical protein T8K17_22745 [Thalassobaculum sp. OXR-137]